MNRKEELEETIKLLQQNLIDCRNLYFDYEEKAAYYNLAIECARKELSRCGYHDVDEFYTD
jgi:hypothetical protein